MLGLQFSFIDYISPIIVTIGIPGKFQVISTLSELMNHAYSCLAWLGLTIDQQRTLKWLFLKFNGLLHPI
jgi:hypothetical protein